MATVDPYSHTQHIASAVLDELAKRTAQCGVPPDVAREHGETLVFLRTTMGHIVEKLDSIEKKLDDGTIQFKEHNNRLTVLETEKKTGIAMALAVGGALWSAFTWYVNIKTGKGP
jgi:hypothetical protein